MVESGNASPATYESHRCDAGLRAVRGLSQSEQTISIVSQRPRPMLQTRVLARPASHRLSRLVSTTQCGMTMRRLARVQQTQFERIKLELNSLDSRDDADCGHEVGQHCHTSGPRSSMPGGRPPIRFQLPVFPMCNPMSALECNRSDNKSQIRQQRCGKHNTYVVQKCKQPHQREAPLAQPPTRVENRRRTE